MLFAAAYSLCIDAYLSEVGPQCMNGDLQIEGRLRDFRKLYRT